MHIIITIAMILLSTGAVAAGFDCSKASTLIEESICSNRQLSQMDDALTIAYKKALASSSNSNAIKQHQKNWMVNERNKCQNVTCLMNSYSKRIMELSKGVGPVLMSGNEAIVPRDQQWTIESFKPYESERGIGTADLYIEGSALIGGKYFLSGKFDLTLGSEKSGPIIIYGGSKFTVGDSRSSVTYTAREAN